MRREVKERSAIFFMKSGVSGQDMELKGVSSLPVEYTQGRGLARHLDIACYSYLFLFLLIYCVVSHLFSSLT